MMRATALLLALAAAGCGGGAEPPVADDAYRIVIDAAPLIRAFGEDTASADEAAEQLALLGPPAVPALAAALGRESRDGRQKAVEVLALIGTPEVVPPLLEAARGDADEDVRADALRALGALGDERARPLLEETLGDARLTVRVGAIMGCATLCTSAASLARLTDVALDPAQLDVALAARTTLASLRAQDAGTRAAIAEALAARQPNDGPPERRALAALLASDGEPAAAMPALLAVLPAVPSMLQRHVLWRLGAIADETAIAAIAGQLGSPDVDVRAYAADALARLQDRGVAPAAAALAGYAGPKPRGPLPPPAF